MRNWRRGLTCWASALPQSTLWGSALNWTTMFKLVPETPRFRAYIDRVLTRPAIQRAQAADAALAAEQDRAKEAAAAAE